MADSFQNPRDQAANEALRAKLDKVIGDLNAAARGAEESMARSNTARQEALSEQQAVAREGSARRGLIGDTSAGSIKQGTEAVGERVGAEEKLNNLIRQRIELEAQAARAAREGSTTADTGLLAAANRVRRAASPEVAAIEAQAAALRAGRTGGVGAAPTITPPAAVNTEASLATQIERERRAIAQLDDSLTRHGALTTEWIGALARGEVTLREFGDQMLQTIGKFSGWAAAAAGVYGALAALNEIRKGAIDTESAIQGLTRFIPDLNRGQAQQQISQNAESTVTPVKDVGEAANSFARIFKNQDDVFTATHVALTASKLDNIELANSYRYLTALTQEYGLSASDLPGIFDQVTAAQDRLGARVSELLPALARSAAAIKNSGGDINQALALEALTIVRTGQTGNTIGTGFSRGASNFYKAPAAQETLRQFGIDPNQGYTQALIQAINKGQTLTGDQRREISKAFFGPLRGGQLASLFSAGPEQVSKFLGQTSPEASKGLAQTQLAKVTDQADQRLKQLGIDLETLGAALANSGLLTDLGLLVGLLNSFLQASTQLLQVYNGLPTAVKDVVGGLLGIAAAAAVLRRFQVIDQLGAFRKQETAFLGSTIGALGNEQRGLARRGLTQQTETLYLQRERDAALAAGDMEAAEGYEKAMQVSLAKQVQIAARRESVQAEINGLEADLTAIKEASRAELAAERERVAGLTGGGGAAAGGALAGATTAEGEANTRTVATTEALTAATVQLSLAQEGLVVAEAELEVATGTSLVASLGAAATAVKSFAFGLGGLAVAAGGYLAYRGAQEINQNSERGVTQVSRATTRKQALDAYRQATNPGGVAAAFEGAFYTPQDDTPDLSRGGITPRQDALKQQLGLIDAQSKAKATGDSKLKEIQSNLTQNLAGAKTDIERVDAIKKAIAELGNDKALQLVEPGTYKAAQARLQRQLDAISTSRASIRSFVESLSKAKDIEGYESETQTIFDVQGPGSTTGFARAAAVMTRLAELMGKTTDPKELATLVTDWKKAQQQIKDNADHLLQNSLALAGTDPGAQASARSDYLSRIQAPITATRNEIKAVTDDVKKQHEGAAKARDELRIAEAFNFGSFELFGKTVNLGDGARVAQLKSQLGKYGDAAKKDSATAKILRELLKQQEQDFKVAQEEMAKANEQAQQSLISAEASFAQAGTRNPVAQAGIAFQYAGRALQALAQSGINDPVQRYQLLTQQRNAANQLVDAQLAQWESGQQLALAQADSGATEQSKLQNAVSFAQGEVDHLRALGSKIDPTKLTGALKSLVDAQSALTDYMRQQARDLIDAQGSLAQSQTNDPVTIARDALTTSQRLLAFDQRNGATEAQLIKDQADVNSKRQALQKSIFDARLQTIDFRASINQIDQQTEIAQLQGLLRSMKRGHAALADIRSVEKQIYDLQHAADSSLNLNVGSIKLPTIYEVRRAIASGRQSARISAAAHINNKTDIKLYVTKDSVGEVAKVLDDALGSSVHGALTAAGLQ